MVFAKDLALGAGQHELDLRSRDTLHRVDRLCQLPLQRTLVSDRLLEVAFAKVLFFKQREVRLGVAEQAGAGQGHARLGGLVGLDGKRCAVVLQLVVDAVLAERARHLAGLGGIDAADERRVARRGDHVQEQVDEQDCADRGTANDQPSASGEPRGKLGERHGLDLRPVSREPREESCERHRSDLGLEEVLSRFGGLGTQL